MERIRVRQNSRQLQSLLHTFVMERKGEIHTPRSIAAHVRDVYGLTIDWHEFSNIMDYLCTINCITHNGHDNSGMCKYFIGRL